MCKQLKTYITIGAVAALFAPFVAFAITTTTSNTTSVTAGVPSGGISGGSSVPLQQTPTPPAADITPPAVITTLAASGPTSNSIALQWTAPGDDGSTGTASVYTVKYNTSIIDSESAWGSASAASGPPAPGAAGAQQNMVISGLNAGTIYYFAVRAKDEAGNQSGLSNSPFATTLPADSTPPLISNVKVGLGAHTVVISWKTDEDSDSQVAYGINTDLGSLASSETLAQNHSITLTGLIANKKYFFLIHSADASGNTGSGEITPFTTLKDTTPPANVGQLAASAGAGQITLSWKNPKDVDFASVLVKRAQFSAPQSPSDGQTVYTGSGTNVTDNGLQGAVTYYYAVFAYDTSGNYASGVVISGEIAGGDAAAQAETPAAPPQAGSSEAGVPQAGAGASVPVDASGGGAISGGTASVSGGGIFETPSVPTGLISGSTLVQLSLSSVTFLTAGESIVLFPDAKNELHAIAGQNLTLAIADGVLKELGASEPVFDFNESSYLMQKNERTASWRVTIQLSDIREKKVGTVRVTQSGVKINLLSVIIDVERRGFVYKEGERGNEPIEGAEASLFVLNPTGVWEKWDSGIFNQQNSQVTAKDGSYGWVVPAGTYFYRVEKDGFRAFESNRMTIASGGVFNNSIRLIEVPPSLAEVIKVGAPFRDNIKNVTRNLGAQSAYVRKVVAEEVQQFVQNEQVQKATEQIVAPAVAGAAAVNVSTAVGLGQLVPYLRFLFTQPLLVFSRRRRKGWGIVYNSLTKLPLALTTVRLIDAATGRIVQSRVTDAEGRYSFFSKQGTYKIQPFQRAFVFPSQFLAGLKEDNQFIDLYHGEPIAVAVGGALITANIPLDPAGAEKPAGALLRQLFWRHFQHGMSILSLILAGGFLIIKPSFVTGGITAFQALTYFLFRRLVLTHKPKSWGIVYEKGQKAPLANTIARIFDKKYNKLLETKVTDKAGKYAFLVGKNEYYVVFERPGYAKYMSDTIDLTKTPEPVSVVGFDVELEKQIMEVP